MYVFKYYIQDLIYVSWLQVSRTRVFSEYFLLFYYSVKRLRDPIYISKGGSNYGIWDKYYHNNPNYGIWDKYYRNNPMFLDR